MLALPAVVAAVVESFLARRTVVTTTRPAQPIATE